MAKQVNYNDPSNYKRTRKKDYELWARVCPAGVKIHNFLENADYVTSTENQVVLSGTLGEQWVIPNAELVKRYRTLEGYSITEKTVKRMKEQWVKVRPNPSMGILFACFVPSFQQGIIQTAQGIQLAINNPSVSHGKGDFIVCMANPNGTPNLNNRWVVNGSVFATTYDIRSFSDCVVKHSNEKEIPKPKELVFPKEKVVSISEKEAEFYLDKVLTIVNKAFKGKGVNISISRAGEELIGPDNIVTAGRYSVYVNGYEVGEADLHFYRNGELGASLNLSEYEYNSEIGVASYKNTEEVKKLCRDILEVLWSIAQMNNDI